MKRNRIQSVAKQFPCRIGLYGGMANNMYVFAKALAESSHEVVFIRDRTDLYAMSQPLWQDCRFVESVTGDRQWSWDEWAQREASEGWQAPDWCVDPLADVPPIDRPMRWVLPTPGYFAYRSLRRLLIDNAYWARLVRWFRSCDVLIVCGVEGEQVACLSGVPYMIWPHGGDIRLAAGFPKTEDRDATTQNGHRSLPHRLAFAFKKADWIGSHDPTGVGGTFCDTTAALAGKPLHHIPIPIPQRPRLDDADRREARRRLFSEFNLPTPQERLLALIPSRVDFSWKGHDKLLDAARNVSDIHFVFAGWGNDYETAMTRVRDSALATHITFLPFSLSKPLLFEMYAASDLVIDQFQHGCYGTSAVEAMAGGIPVMMYIDGASFSARGWEAPPVLNCKNPDEIEATLKGILDGGIDLKQAGRQAASWAHRVHSPDIVAAAVNGLLGGRIRRRFAWGSRKSVAII